MTEWEYLKTKTAAEFAEWLRKEITDLLNEPRTHISTTAKCIEYLQAEHTTTADEDFAEINFFLNNFKEFGKPSEVVSYGCGHDAYMVAIFKDGNNVYSADSGLRWTDNQIDQIRIIADKKRKECGWDK